MVLIAPQNLQADSSPTPEVISLRNHVTFFSKPDFQSILSQAECRTAELEMQIPLPQNNLQVQKIFETEESCDLNSAPGLRLKSKIQIFFHQRAEQKYLSQQVLLTATENSSEGGSEIAFCTSYFDLQSPRLVPGACIGKFAQRAYGIALSE